MDFLALVSHEKRQFMVRAQTRLGPSLTRSKAIQRAVALFGRRALTLLGGVQPAQAHTRQLFSRILKGF